MNNPLLTVEELRLSFLTPKGDVEAIKGINFTLHENEIVGLIGESGCGKSLTAQALLQLWPSGSHRHSGKISYKNQELLSLTENEMEKVRGKEMSLIFQDPSAALNPTMKIGTQLIEGLRLHKKMAKQEAWRIGEEWLETVGITHPSYRMNQYPHELSGGMKQRICIAMAMVCNPSLLVADEPTTALDVTIQAQILELFKLLRMKFQTTILLITHDLGVVARCCDRVMVMYAGQIVESAPVDQLFSAPQHPHTKTLLESKRGLS